MNTARLCFDAKIITGRSIKQPWIRLVKRARTGQLASSASQTRRRLLHLMHVSASTKHRALPHQQLRMRLKTPRIDCTLHRSRPYDDARPHLPTVATTKLPNATAAMQLGGDARSHREEPTVRQARPSHHFLQLTPNCTPTLTTAILLRIRAHILWTYHAFGGRKMKKRVL